MISLDWKERLENDVDDFFTRKMPQGDYDIKIIYNAYPERIEGKVPREVITFVAKRLASLCAKKPQEHIKFYEYLWTSLGEDGRTALAYILSRITKKKPDEFLDFLQKLLEDNVSEHEAYLMLDKVLLPLLKKDPQKHITHTVRWLRKSSAINQTAIMKTLIKLAKAKPEHLGLIFDKLEGLWMYADENMIRLQGDFLKAIAKIDRDFYISIFQKFHQTRTPVFVEILTSGIATYEPIIEEAVQFWMTSGNARLKKAAVNGKRTLSRKKKDK